VRTLISSLCLMLIKSSWLSDTFLFPSNYSGSRTIDLCPPVSITRVSGVVCVVLGTGVPMCGPDILGYPML